MRKLIRGLFNFYVFCIEINLSLKHKSKLPEFKFDVFKSFGEKGKEGIFW